MSSAHFFSGDFPRSRKSNSTRHTVTLTAAPSFRTSATTLWAAWNSVTWCTTYAAEVLQQSRDANEYAFALGALAGYASDIAGHPAVNQAVSIQYPKLRAKFGNSVSYAQDHTALENGVWIRHGCRLPIMETGALPLPELGVIGRSVKI
jgi:hypothetical protein